MKRTTTFVMAFLMILSLCVPYSAQARFENARDLYQVWAGPQQFPDYVCGVWSNDGTSNNLTISVLNTKEGNDGKKEILELIENDSSVTFEYGEYSRNYLISVQTQVSKLFKTHEEHGLVGTAYLDDKNRISLLFLKEYEPNENTQQLLSDLKSEYGDVFLITFGDAPVDDTLLTAPIGNDFAQKNNKSSISTIILIVLLIFSIAFMFVHKRRTKALKTNTGDIITTESKISLKQIEKLIEKEDFSPSAELDSKIMSSINEQN